MPVAIVHPSEQAILDASTLLSEGGLVGMPTETVYGLAGDATNAQAIARIFAAKGRPSFNPLIAHIVDLEAAEGEALFDGRARTLAAAFWPGPLTLVLPARPDGSICELARAGLPSVALRSPAHPVALDLLRAFGKPIAAPSGNISGRLSPTNAADVAHDLAESLGLILDAGACKVGLESTIISLMPNETARLLRPGGLPRAAIEALIGSLDDTAAKDDDTIIAPGMLTSHYAPRATLRLNVTTFRAGEAILAFGPETPPGAINLSQNGDLVEAAANLFTYLRRLDILHPSNIAVTPIPNHGLGEAINDRLRRAAAPRF